MENEKYKRFEMLLCAADFRTGGERIGVSRERARTIFYTAIKHSLPYLPPDHYFNLIKPPYGKERKLVAQACKRSLLAAYAEWLEDI